MSDFQIISSAQLRQAIDWPDLLQPVARAFDAYSTRKAGGAMQILYPQADESAGDVYVKTGFDWNDDNFVVKVSPWFRINREQGNPQGGFFALVCARTGHTRAILNEEHYLSDIRTAAAGALAARVLAPRDVQTACVVGTGTQALLQPQALYRERPFERLLVWGRNTTGVARLMTQLQFALPHAEIVASNSLEWAVKHSQVVMTTTASKEPLIDGRWLSAGQHLTAVGADDPSKCELDALCLQSADVIAVDSLSDNLANGDVHRHIDSIPLPHRIVEIGHLLGGRHPGRTDRTQITLAKFVGLGVQDLAAATESLRRLSGSAISGATHG